MIYVYAIREAAAPPPAPERRGLGRARLRLTTCDGVAGVFSRHRTLQPRPVPTTMWAHEAVVDHLMRRGPVLPVRFGTMLGDEQELRALLADRQEELVRGLERVRGRVELSVRVVGAAGPGGPREQVSGREYLMARREAYRRAEQAIGEVHEPLTALAHDARVRIAPAPPTIAEGAYLVDQANVDAFIARVRALAAARDDVSIVGTGPWPPYSFVPQLRS